MKEFNTQDEIEAEIVKCKNNPYYFATTYLRINYKGMNIPFETPLSEEQFNNYFRKYDNK